jgi:hypothetical protein
MEASSLASELHLPTQHRGKRCEHITNALVEHTGDPPSVLPVLRFNAVLDDAFASAVARLAVARHIETRRVGNKRMAAPFAGPASKVRRAMSIATTRLNPRSGGGPMAKCRHREFPTSSAMRKNAVMSPVTFMRYRSSDKVLLPCAAQPLAMSTSASQTLSPATRRSLLWIARLYFSATVI